MAIRLLETGFHPDELAALTAGIEDDAVALAEMQLMVRESRWQVSDIMNELGRRWTELEADGAGRALVEHWLKRTEPLINS